MAGKKSTAELMENCNEASRYLKLMAHPERLKLLCLLSEGPRTVNDLTENTELSQSGVSQCLGKMRSEGLLESERDGHFVHYRIGDERVVQLVQALHKIFCV